MSDLNELRAQMRKLNEAEESALRNLARRRRDIQDLQRVIDREEALQPSNVLTFRQPEGSRS